MNERKDIRVEGTSGQPGQGSSERGKRDAPQRSSDSTSASRNTEIGWYTPRDQWLSSPLHTMREMARDMNRFFEGFGLSPLSGDVGRMLESSPFRSGSSTWPAIEVFDRDGRMVIRAELPGMKKEDVHVRTVDNYMIIEGERRSEQEQQREGFYQSEWSYGRFSRAITLPERVEPQQVSARFENGVLEVSLDLPRRASQEIPIEAGSHSGRIGSATNAPSQGQPGTGGASKVREQPGGP